MLSLSKSASRPTGGMWVRTVRISLPLHKVMGLLPLYAPFSFPPRPLHMSPGLGENVPLPSIKSVQCCSPELLPLLVEESDSNSVECLWHEDNSTQQWQSQTANSHHRPQSSSRSSRKFMSVSTEIDKACTFLF